MPQRPPDVVPEIVQRDLTEEQLQAYLASPHVSVDTETLGLHQLRDRLCLVQLCDRAGRGTLVQIPRDQVISSSPLESRAPRLKRLQAAPRECFGFSPVRAQRGLLGYDRLFEH